MISCIILTRNHHHCRLLFFWNLYDSTQCRIFHLFHASKNAKYLSIRNNSPLFFSYLLTSSKYNFLLWTFYYTKRHSCQEQKSRCKLFKKCRWTRLRLGDLIVAYGLHLNWGTEGFSCICHVLKPLPNGVLRWWLQSEMKIWDCKTWKRKRERERNTKRMKGRKEGGNRWGMQAGGE